MPTPNENLSRSNLNEANTVYQRAGLCIDCGKPRGADGTKWNCRPCADIGNARRAEKRRARQRSK